MQANSGRGSSKYKIALSAQTQTGGRILLMRNHTVIADADLAKLDGVPTKVQNRAVQRHPQRVPAAATCRSTRSAIGRR